MPPPPPYRYWYFLGLGDEPLLVQTYDAPRDVGWDVLDPLFVRAYLDRWLLESESRATLYEVHAALFGELAATGWGAGEERLSLLPLLGRAFERQDLVVLAARRRNAVLPGRPAPPQPLPPPPPPPPPLLLGDLGVLVIDRTTGLAVGGASLAIVGPQSVTATTGTDGIFIFRDLRPGQYSITATKALLGSSRGSATVIGGASVSAPSPAIPVQSPLAFRSSLAGPTAAGGAPAPVPPTGPGTTLFLTSAPITGDLTVFVVDSVRGPIPLASVQITGPTSLSAQADGSGQADFAGLPPGAYTVTATQTGFSGPPSAGAVNAGTQSVATVLLTALGDLTLTVVDTLGNKQSGASVSLNGPSTASGPTDGSGQVNFTDIPIGSYTATASKAGFTSGSSAPVVRPGLLNADIVILTAALADLTVRVDDNFGGHIVGASVVLTGPATPSGTTVDGGLITFTSLPPGSYTVTASNAGFSPATRTLTISAGANNSTTLVLTFLVADLVVQVNDSFNLGIGSANVAITGPFGANLDTDGSGSAPFRSIPTGVYTVTASKTDLRTARQQAVPVALGAANTATLVLVPATTDLVVSTFDNFGDKLPDVTVTVTGPSPGAGLSDATTKQAKFAGLNVGSYTVDGSKANYVNAKTVTVTLVPNASAATSLTLTSLVEFLVTVNEASTKSALKGALVSIISPSASPPKQTTPASGKVRFSGIPADSYVVTATAVDHVDGIVTVPVVVGSTATTIDLVLLQPLVTLAEPRLVPVKRAYTKAARKPVTLSLNAAFTGTCTLTRDNARAKVFTALTGGTEITFNGTDNVFASAPLVAPGGVQLFVEGATVSGGVDDTELKLSITGGTRHNEVKLTVVDVRIDICGSRTTVASDPAVLPDPAAPGSAAVPRDKATTGRFLHVQDTGNHHGRALLLVGVALPAGITHDILVVPTDAAGNQLALFPGTNEHVTAGESAAANPLVIASAANAAARRFWVQAQRVSGALVDTGYRVGLRGVDDEIDRVAATAVQFSNLVADIPSTPPLTARAGNAAARHTLTIAGSTPAHWDFDDGVNTAMVLLEDSVRADNLINLSVTVVPSTVPVSWDIPRISARLPTAILRA